MAPNGSAELGSYELPIPEAREGADRPCPQDLQAPLPNAMLASNALWFCRLRWIVIAPLAGLGIVGLCGDLPYRLGLKGRGVWALVTAVLLSVYNTAFLVHARHARRSRRSRSVLANLWGQIILDLLVLTAVIHFVGSMDTNVAFVYLFHIALACVFFTARQSLIITGVACVLYLACIAAEQTGVAAPAGIFLDPALQPGAPVSQGQAMVSVFSVWIILLGVWYLTSHISVMLRRRDRQLADTNLRLIAARKERTQHMLHTAHQLKGPCAAIDANTQLLLAGYGGDLPKEALDVLARIAARCRAMTVQVQDMLQLANLRSRGQQPPRRRRLDVSEVLRWCLNQVGPAAGQKQVVLEADLGAAETTGVEDHLRMLFLNLLTNAVNYSHEHTRVNVQCHVGPKGQAQVTIADEGIGILGEQLPHIFDAYYRTPEAVEHNRRSSGLGLAIVQQVAQSHRIRLRVESQIGKGTRFVLQLPPPDDVRDEAVGAREVTDGQHHDC